jgi:hypothetical protein
MKKLLFAGFAFLFLATSCKKDNPSGNNVASPFMTLASGTTWNYETTDNATSTVTPYTLTSTNIDTVVGSRSYHVFNSVDANGSTQEYYNISGDDYYQFTQIAAQLPTIELLYLKNNAANGTNWTTPIAITQQGLSINASVKNTIESNNTSVTVNGTTYNNVIKVRTEINNATVTVPGIPFPLPITVTQNMFAHYAPKYGLVERNTALKMDIQGQGTIIDINTTNRLISSNIQ